MMDKMSESEIVVRIHAMGIESLSPEAFDGLEAALRELISNRHIQPLSQSTAELWSK